jgi:hypothetical protein
MDRTAEEPPFRIVLFIGLTLTLGFDLRFCRPLPSSKPSTRKSHYVKARIKDFPTECPQVEAMLGLRDIPEKNVERAKYSPPEYSATGRA